MAPTRAAGLMLGLILAMGLTSLVAAQESKEAWKESGMELKVYDIKAFLDRTPIYNFARVPGTDQVAMTPSFNLTSALEATTGASGATIFDPLDSDPDYQREVRARQTELRELIQRLVSPKEPWAEMGGRGSVEFLSSRGLMFVKTTPDGHQQIQEILKHVLPGPKQSVAVDIQVVELKEGGLGERPVAGFVARTEADRDALKKAIGKVHQQVALTGTDGQVLSNERGVSHAYVASLEPVVAELTTGLNTEVGVLSDGLAIEVQPTVSSDGKMATLDFRMNLSRTVAMRTGMNGTAVPLQKMQIPFDLPSLASDSQAGTVTVPLGSPMIVAGGTVPAKLLDRKAADDAADITIYYVATVRVIEAAPAEKK